MTKTVAIFLTICSFFLLSSCLDGVDDNPEDRSPEKEQRELEAALAILVEEGYDIDTSALGIYYIIHEEGEGAYPQPGDTLSLEYTGYLLGGLIFDASAYHYEDAIWEFIYKEEDLIPGFDDGLSLMNKGTGIDMIIPSHLAYGEEGYGLIKPYSTVVFTAKMHDLKPGNLQE